MEASQLKRSTLFGDRRTTELEGCTATAGIATTGHQLAKTLGEAHVFEQVGREVENRFSILQRRGTIASVFFFHRVLRGLAAEGFMKFCVFAKHLQGMSLAEACGRVAAAGFGGLDLTVRAGGYVDPARVTQELPGAIATIRSHGLEVPLLTTGIVEADAAAVALMMTAGDCGVREIKLHYWPIDTTQPMQTQIDAAAAKLAKIADSARKSGVRANIHNHSGDCLQHSAWVVERLVRDHDPNWVGVYFDPAHYTIEGGLSGWSCAARMLASRVSLLAVKDFRWVDAARPATLEGHGWPTAQERRWVPVGTGNTPWAQSLQLLHDGGFDETGGAWASIHGEYQGRWSFRELTSIQVLEQCRSDREFLEKILHAKQK